MPINLNLDADLVALKATNTGASKGALEFFNELLQFIDKALRSVRNAFGTAALANTGTTAGAVPMVNASNKIDVERMPSDLPASRVVAGGGSTKFKVSQIPAVFASKTTGRFAEARFGNLPATKLVAGRAGKIPAEKLPVGYKAPEVWPTASGPGPAGSGDP